jgi:hypothetical protein
MPRMLCSVFCVLSSCREIARPPPGLPSALWPRAVPAGRGALGRGPPARSGTERPGPWEQKAPRYQRETAKAAAGAAYIKHGVVGARPRDGAAKRKARGFCSVGILGAPRRFTGDWWALGIFFEHQMATISLPSAPLAIPEPR